MIDPIQQMPDGAKSVIDAGAFLALAAIVAAPWWLELKHEALRRRMNMPDPEPHPAPEQAPVKPRPTPTPPPPPPPPGE